MERHPLYFGHNEDVPASVPFFTLLSTWELIGGLGSKVYLQTSNDLKSVLNTQQQLCSRLYLC